LPLLIASPARPKLAWLQIFRGFAAVLVVIHHVTGSTDFYLHSSFLGGLFTVGWLGVDFFFVLSGFIITYIHYGDIGNRSTLKAYATKRFLRIYPIYWIVALLAIIPFIKSDWLFLLKSTLLLPQLKEPYLAV